MLVWFAFKKETQHCSKRAERLPWSFRDWSGKKSKGAWTPINTLTSTLVSMFPQKLLGKHLSHKSNNPETASKMLHKLWTGMVEEDPSRAANWTLKSLFSRNKLLSQWRFFPLYSRKRVIRAPAATLYWPPQSTKTSLCHCHPAFLLCFQTIVKEGIWYTATGFSKQDFNTSQ
jgi:hypothetical protein